MKKEGDFLAVCGDEVNRFLIEPANGAFYRLSVHQRKGQLLALIAELGQFRDMLRYGGQALPRRPYSHFHEIPLSEWASR